ncbi:MAG: substrate-binding domain-containing protein [Acetivibrionales bacterium]
MKVRGRLFISILIIIILAAAAYFTFKTVRSRPLDEDTRIVVILKSLDPTMEFWDVVEEGVYVAANEFEIKKVEITGPEVESDVEGQIRIVEETIRSKPDAIVLAAGDYNMLVPSAERIVKSGIKLVTIDSGLNCDLSRSFIATDNIEAGRKAGEAMASIIEKDSEVAIVSHTRGTATAIEREQGVRESLSKYPSIKILDTFFSDNDQENAYRITENLLKSNPGIRGIIGLNETSTKGVARAIKELGMKNKVKLVGFDNSIEEIKYIEEGIIQAIVVQNPFNMGYRGIEMAVKVLKGEKVEKRIDTGSVVVTKENMYTSENQKLLFPFIDR